MANSTEYENAGSELEAMIAETHTSEDENMEESGENSTDLDNSADQQEGTSEGTSENAEDETDNDGGTDHTDADNSESNDAETKSQNDEDGSDSDEDDGSEGLDEDEANTRVDSEDEKAEDDDKSESASEADTTNESDGSDSDTDKTSLSEKASSGMSEAEKLEFDTMKTFYDKVTADFTANGKKVKGFKDADQFIQSNQMSYKFGDKMAGFKQYKPFMGPLKDRGMIDDEAKFNLAMNIMDGDPEALKTHIKNLGLDPYEDLGLDEINYSGKSTVSSEADMAIKETIDRADKMGVTKQLDSIVGKEWDDSSVDEFMDSENVRTDLLNHLADGTYDVVMDRVRDLNVTKDGFMDGTDLDKYRAAYTSLVDDVRKNKTSESEKEKVVKTESKAKNKPIDEDAMRLEIAAKIEKEEMAKYKTKMDGEKKNDAAREKAASLSKKKVVSKVAKKTEIDPLTLDEGDFKNYFDKMITG